MMSVNDLPDAAVRLDDTNQPSDGCDNRSDLAARRRDGPQIDGADGVWAVLECLWVAEAAEKSRGQPLKVALDIPCACVAVVPSSDEKIAGRIDAESEDGSLVAVKNTNQLGPDKAVHFSVLCTDEVPNGIAVACGEGLDITKLSQFGNFLDEFATVFPELPQRNMVLSNGEEWQLEFCRPCFQALPKECPRQLLLFTPDGAA